MQTYHHSHMVLRPIRIVLQPSITHRILWETTSPEWLRQIPTHSLPLDQAAKPDVLEALNQGGVTRIKGSQFTQLIKLEGLN